MNDAPKSAYEIALEKLKQQDKERGEKGPAALTAAQKRAIAGIRKKCEARLAQAEILWKSDRAKTLRSPEVDPEALRKMDEHYASERRQIEEQKDAEIAAVRAGKGGQR